MKHTPGPWIAWSTDGENHTNPFIAQEYSVVQEACNIASVVTDGEWWVVAVPLAQAAAAPELLEACVVVRGAIVFGNGRDIDWNAIADQLGAAIAKATAIDSAYTPSHIQPTEGRDHDQPQT